MIEALCEGLYCLELWLVLVPTHCGAYYKSREPFFVVAGNHINKSVQFAGWARVYEQQNQVFGVIIQPTKTLRDRTNSLRPIRLMFAVVGLLLEIVVLVVFKGVDYFPRHRLPDCVNYLREYVLFRLNRVFLKLSRCHDLLYPSLHIIRRHIGMLKMQPYYSADVRLIHPQPRDFVM